MTVVESLDIGAPLSAVYNQWTEFEDFPGFTKKVQRVDQESDERLRWRVRVLWSHRTWDSKIIEQVPDRRIVWRSQGDKGYVDGAVAFHELTPELTRIVLVLEYHPKGLVEHVGRLWRAQERRVRLELKQFRRHVMTRTLLRPDGSPDGGWRGEIQDGHVTSRPGEEDTSKEPAEKNDEREESGSRRRTQKKERAKEQEEDTPQAEERQTDTDKKKSAPERAAKPRPRRRTTKSESDSGEERAARPVRRRTASKQSA
ncbi:SRPBCC family protein [Sinosporangium siamense]|nr:SRPBCC family protein [Sinosporangium siamense]